MGKINYLMELANKYGNFKICSQKDGVWSKHKSVLECWESRELWRLEYATERTCLKNEIILDLDPELNQKREIFILGVKNIISILEKTKEALKLKNIYSDNYYNINSDLKELIDFLGYNKFKIRKNFFDYKLYSTGSKGYHIHVRCDALLNLENRAERELFRNRFINQWVCLKFKKAIKGESLKASENVMVLLEGEKNRKTGIKKQEITIKEIK